MNARPQVVGAVFIRDGNVFAAKRGHSKYAYVAHKYEFVGGKVEIGETPEDAIRREVREEMSVSIEIESPYVTVDYDYPDFSIRLITFLCRMTGEPTLLEHESAAWIPIDGLDADTWAPADRVIIERLRRDFGTKA